MPGIEALTAAAASASTAGDWLAQGVMIQHLTERKTLAAAVLGVWVTAMFVIVWKHAELREPSAIGRVWEAGTTAVGAAVLSFVVIYFGVAAVVSLIHLVI